MTGDSTFKLIDLVKTTIDRFTHGSEQERLEAFTNRWDHVLYLLTTQTTTCCAPSSTSRCVSSDAWSLTCNCGIEMIPCETMHTCERSVSMRSQLGADVAIRRRCTLPPAPRQRNGGMLPLLTAVGADRPHDLKEGRASLVDVIRDVAVHIERRPTALVAETWVSSPILEESRQGCTCAHSEIALSLPARKSDLLRLQARALQPRQRMQSLP